MRTKAEASGFAILFIGVALLAFTFINAYLLLREDLSIIASSDLVSVFGEAFAPLVQTCIRIMYLGVMGWIGSILTIRGVPLLTQFRGGAPSMAKSSGSSEALQEAWEEALTEAKQEIKPRTKKAGRAKKAKKTKPSKQLPGDS